MHKCQRFSYLLCLLNHKVTMTQAQKSMTVSLTINNSIFCHPKPSLDTNCI